MQLERCDECARVGQTIQFCESCFDRITGECEEGAEWRANKRWKNALAWAEHAMDNGNQYLNAFDLVRKAHKEQRELKKPEE